MLTVFLCLGVEAEAADVSSTIKPGIYAENVVLSGKNAVEAKAAIEAYVNKLQATEITLQDGNGNQVKITAGDLGVFWANKELVDEALEFGSKGNVIERYKVIKDLVKNPSIKIWSAACSTGDEPYSLVMLLAKYLPLNRIRIIATDIDKQVLEKAQAGLYNKKSLKGLPDEFRKKYFDKVGDVNYKIRDEVKKCVDFKIHNLLLDPYPAGCDLIVCRNVLIYFTEEAKEQIYVKFFNS